MYLTPVEPKAATFKFMNYKSFQLISFALNASFNIFNLANGRRFQSSQRSLVAKGLRMAEDQAFVRQDKQIIHPILVQESLSSFPRPRSLPPLSPYLLSRATMSIVKRHFPLSPSLVTPLSHHRQHTFPFPFFTLTLALPS